MRRRILRSFLLSLEWRIVAYAITNVFLWITTGHFWKAAGLALILQLILFLAYMTWHLLRNELHTPWIPAFIIGPQKPRRERRR